MAHETESPRRRFLKQAGVSSGLAASALLPAAPDAKAQSSPPRAPAPDALVFFNADEADFMRAVVDVFIPKDVLGASAFPQSAGKNPTGPVGATTLWAAQAIKERYLKVPGGLA